MGSCTLSFPDPGAFAQAISPRPYTGEGLGVRDSGVFLLLVFAFADPRRVAGKDWQLDRKLRVLARLALHFDLSAVSLDDPVSHRKAQAGSIRFCGKKRIKDLRKLFGRDAHARIPDRNHQLVTLLH